MLWEANWLVLFTMIEREVEVEAAVKKSSSWQDEKFEQGIYSFQIQSPQQVHCHAALNQPLMLGFRVGQRGFRKENEEQLDGNLVQSKS